MVAPRSSLLRPAVAVFTIAFPVYALTAARTITFWDGSHYAVLARTLSISNPPGSLLLTLLGRYLGDVPFAWPMAFRLNLLAAMIAAAAAAVVTRAGLRLARAPAAPESPAFAGALLAGLLFAFAPTVWFHATQFNPYGLSALFTGLLLLAFLRWWDGAAESDAPARAALVALLFGLDISVHRANVLLVPAVIAAVLLRRPRAAVSARFLGATAGAFVAGAALQLLYIPISRREPFLDGSLPDSLVGLWHFVRMDDLGGGFLVDVWPRHADFFRVQLADLGSFARVNLGAAPWGWLAGAAFAILGLAVLARRTPRLAIAWTLFALATGLGAVVYFNRPAEYFRPLDRHYLACLVTVAPLMAVGLAAAITWVRVRGERTAAIAFALLALALPIAAVATNWRSHDFSGARFAETFARDHLEPLPRGAILFTNGDNDSFPLWYLQQVEHVRTDVAVVNLSLTTSARGLRRVRRLDPALASFAITDTFRARPDSLLANLVTRVMGSRPTFVAGTIPLTIPVHLELAGLSRRAVSTPADSTWSRAAAERFVSERLPRTGLDDRREILSPDLLPLAINEAAVAVQLAEQQIAEKNGAAALRTLDVLERSFPAWRYPPHLDPQRLLGPPRALATELVTNRR